MAKLCVCGGQKLHGSTLIPGAKNAVLPMMAASLLTGEPIELSRCPRLLDVENMLTILRILGCGGEWKGESLLLDAGGATRYDMPEKLAKELRSSIFMLGPVVGRFKQAKFTYPGGCEIGNRPIDLHLRGLAALNVDIKEEHGYILCDGSRMRGADIHLDYPSVGATENLMMAAVMSEGASTIQNAAREPEIPALQSLLNAMGARVKGAGTSTIFVDGGHTLHGAVHSLIPDRIVAGTLMVAAAVTGGNITLSGLRSDHMLAVLSKLRECGCSVEEEDTWVRISAPQRLKELRLIETLPHPGFPTDMQAQFCSLCAVAQGTSVVIENVFESRFKHISELIRMGASVTVKDRAAIIRGVDKLTGTTVQAHDLRGGAALVIAGLCAEGMTTVEGAHYIDRGYANFEGMLSELGADVARVE